jgi:DNA-binding response OmpR family regulator
MTKILLVEDDKDLLNIYQEELKFSGIEYDIAETGKDAIDKDSTFEYDVILLDIMLPDIQGLEVLRKIKERNKDKKVIIISNLEVPAIINQAYSLGVSAYLIKAELLPSQIVEEVKRII